MLHHGLHLLGDVVGVQAHPLHDAFQGFRFVDPGCVALFVKLLAVVGEFESQHSLDNPHVHPQPDGRLMIEGAASIRELNKSLGWHLPSDGPKTLNGLVTEALETIPESSVCLKIGRYRLEILETEDNRVTQVLVWHTSSVPAVAPVR